MNTQRLLVRDGVGFFSLEDRDAIAVRASDERQEAFVQATQKVRHAIADFYERSGRALHLDVVSPNRAIVIDGDIAVPGHPTVFTVGGAKTLYLHWTTAASDIETLLDVPSFEAIATGQNPSAACGSATKVGLGSADGVLAYIDEVPDVLGAGTRVPLGDSSPKQSWPWPVTAAALVTTAGGVVLHRRDKIFGDRHAPVRPPAQTLLEASKPRLPVADLPPDKPRVIYLDDESTTPTSPPNESPTARREIDLHAKRAESALTRSVEKAAAIQAGPLLGREDFARQINLEWSRRRRGGRDGAVASLALSELDAVRLRLGAHAADQLFDEVADAIADLVRPLDVLGLAGENELAILMPELDEETARDALDELAKKITAVRFTVGDERVLLTPATGFAMLSDTKTAPDLVRAIESARALSMLNLHLDPERWDGQTTAPVAKDSSSTSWATVKAKLRTPAQIALTFVIGWVLPFFAYFGMEAIGLDISFVIYVLVVAALVLTGAFILAEGMMAIKQKEPPEEPTVPFPKASALIAAYLPNEAATVIETIESFLALDYPNEVQIILAYNTPDPLPVEEHLDRIAAEHPNFVPVRIVGSNSKAQNVNAALSMADGEFIGMFDADHQPRPDAFTRAWRWIDAGYDVVQGHCLTRNGDAGWLAKMIAVEFESIYTVAHPGRAKMHRFGVFGGSNGFWRTELLHETRMRGSMLTEDIDSSMRVIERGFKIRSDRDLVSRELATTTFQQVWNQRMRWAQGWFQVSLEHVKLSLRSKELTVRQKLGLFHLLMWREIYPWLSQQLFPLLAFWALRAGGIGELDWTVPIFVATTIFTFSVGPLQCAFAYKLADPEIKQHKKWFWGYLLFTTPFYTEYKNLISRVAHVKQFMGESDWRVTPRSSD